MYTGQIYHKGIPITVQGAIDLDLITVDENNDVWLKHDTMKVIKIHGDLQLN